MNEKQLQLVTFEQAKRLKEAGFDWEVCRYDEVYNQQGVLCDVEEDGAMWDNFNEEEYYSGYYSATTVALALKWFREVKNNDNYVRFFDYEGKRYYGGKFYQEIVGEFTEKCTKSFDTYESAESALLDELITLIDKEK